MEDTSGDDKDSDTENDTPLRLTPWYHLRSTNSQEAADSEQPETPAPKQLLQDSNQEFPNLSEPKEDEEDYLSAAESTTEIEKINDTPIKLNSDSKSDFSAILEEETSDFSEVEEVQPDTTYGVCKATE
ncbi:hypothetical protein HDU83_009838, partial [Entophlyctis luteolus]